MNLADEYKKLIDELFSRIEKLEKENKELMFYGMSDSEYQRYQSWRKNHKCVSQVEITTVPCCVQDLIKVRCFKCNETIQISDFTEA